MPADPSRPVVLITGASGLLGTRIARDLARDHRVVGLDVKPPREDAAAALEFVECDLTTDAGTARALARVRELAGERIASVVHLAAYYSFSGEPSDLYEKLTVRGTRRLLAGLQAFAVEQFIFSSSMLVHRPAEPGELIREDSPIEAQWDYPRSKIAAEEVIEREHGPIPALILRIAGVYDEDGHSIPITQQIHRIHQKTFESFFFPGDKHRGQAFVHLDDVVAAVRAAIARRGRLPPYEVLLIAEPDVMTYQELQEEIGLALHGHEWPTIRIPAPVAKAGAWVQEKLPGVGDPFIKPFMIDMADAHYPIAIDRARERIGFEPRHRLRDTLPEMLRRLQADPRRFYEVNGLPVEDLEE